MTYHATVPSNAFSGSLLPQNRPFRLIFEPHTYLTIIFLSTQTPPFQIIHTLPFSNLHTYVYAALSRSNSFVQALYDQAPIFRQVMIQLSLLNAFPYASKKQINAPSLFSYFLSLSMALILFSFILWLWSLEDRVNVGFMFIAPSHGAHHRVFYKQANEFTERHKYR